MSIKQYPPFLKPLPHTEDRLNKRSSAIIMGILNVTPDSFSDGGQYNCVAKAIDRASQMIEEGVDIIDVGGESTRPNAKIVSLAEELERVIPVIQAIRERFDISISIDTSKPGVMEAAVEQGANLINDVCALQHEGALDAAAKLGAPVCLMHMEGDPRTMQNKPHYQSVVSEVFQFLKQRIDACLKAGIPKSHIIIDPGIGFGKLLQHNCSLIRDLEAFQSLGCDILIGVSRKSMIGQLTGESVDDRLIGSIAAAIIAYENGARYFRVHDIKETRAALSVAAAIKQGENID